MSIRLLSPGWARPLARVLLIAGAAPLSAQTPVPSGPVAPPAPMPLRAAVIPPFQEATLPNGVRVVLVENHRQPSVVFRLVMPAGTIHDPANKAGTSALVATLLTKGAGARSAEQFATAIENTGGGLQAISDDDYLSIFGSVLSNATPLALSLLGDAVARPTFAPTEVTLAQTQTLSGLQLSGGSPGFLAGKTFRAGLYGAHPYGVTPTATTVRAITRADIQQFHAAYVRPQGALLVVAGDITMAQLKAWTATAFAGWTGAPAGQRRLPPPPPPRKGPEIILVHRPGSVQSNVLVGNLAIGPADSLRLPAELALQVLGGGSDGRLFKILREQKGWTYGAYASLTRPRGIGRVEANAEVRTVVTDSAVREMLAQLTRIGREPIPATELEDTRGGMVGSFPLALETPGGLAALVAFVKLYGLPANYLQTYRPRLSRVTASDVAAAARRVVRPSEALIVVVGDGVALYDKLAKIAPVTLRNADGDVLQPSDLVPTSSGPAAFDVTRLKAHRDSFVITMQGQTLGHAVTAVSATSNGWAFEELTAVGGGMVQMRSVLESDAQLTPRSLQQSGTVQGQSVATAIEFADGKARGRAQNVTPTGPATKAIDLAIPAGTVVADAIRTIVPLFRWNAQSRQTLTVFTPATGVVEPFTLTVVGSESVTVPAGTFECWKIEQTGGPAPAVYYLSKTDNRVVQFGSPVQPVLIQLAK